jgi:hypothetical protein
MNTKEQEQLQLIADLSIRNKKYEFALKKIAKWFGEFHRTGDFINGHETSYEGDYGSNGARDYMREVAEEALK